MATRPRAGTGCKPLWVLRSTKTGPGTWTAQGPCWPAWLVGRQQGLTQLQVVWTRAPRHHGVPPPAPLVVRTAQATQDTTHLEHLVRERLNRTTLAAPVVRTGLVVDATEPLASGTHPLLATANLHTGWDRHELLERLVSRLGRPCCPGRRHRIRLIVGPRLALEARASAGRHRAHPRAVGEAAGCG